MFTPYGALSKTLDPLTQDAFQVLHAWCLPENCPWQLYLDNLMSAPIIILPPFLEHHFVCTFNRHDMQKHAMKCPLNGISITLSENVFS